MRFRSRGERAAIACVFLLGCGGSSATPAPPPSVFLAFAQDFAGFHGWPSFDLGTSFVPGSGHLSGHRRVFVSALPPAGAAQFPVGTMIVKEVQDEPPEARLVFAMVKRGGGFNATGARDWEWFELKNVADGTVVIDWRGVGPATGDSYGGDPNGGCNRCHTTAAEFDFVQDLPVRELLAH